MFNIFEGNDDAKARKLQERLEILRRARADGFFAEERIEPIPEIVADGVGPDDGYLRDPENPPHRAPRVERAREALERAVHEAPTEKEELEVAERPRASPRPYQPLQWCYNCGEMTRHVTYGIGNPPPWHCAVCCTCDLCMETLANPPSQQRSVPLCPQHDGMAQVERAREALERAVHEAPEEQYFFCTKCGAALRCTTCRGAGTGNYCDLCGKRMGTEGHCTDCWKAADSDG